MIESNPAGIQGISKAINEGHEVSFITADPDFYLHESVHAKAAFNDPRCSVIKDSNIFDVKHLLALVLELHKTKPIQAVTTFSEYHTIHTAEVAKALNLPGMNPDAARKSRFKHLTRIELAKAGVPQPRFRHIQLNESEIRSAILEIGLPCIIKPADGTASLDVIFINTVEDVDKYILAINGSTNYGRGVTRSQDFLVEEYVEGALISVESCVTGSGQILNFGITDRRLVGFPHFIEMGGTFFWEHPEREQLFSLNTKALNALGVDFGFIHMEFILSKRGPLVLEVNARLAGGILPKMFEAASGVDPFLQVIKQAMGSIPALPYPIQKTATGRQFGSPVGGKFCGINMGEISGLPGYVEAIAYPTPGTMITSLSKSNFDWLGHVIFTGTYYEESLKAAEQALSQINLAVETPALI
jgi:cysteine synthase A